MLWREFRQGGSSGTGDFEDINVPFISYAYRNTFCNRIILFGDGNSLVPSLTSYVSLCSISDDSSTSDGLVAGQGGVQAIEDAVSLTDHVIEGDGFTQGIGETW
jgi:hypothetical protein